MNDCGTLKKDELVGLLLASKKRELGKAKKEALCVMAVENGVSLPKAAKTPKEEKKTKSPKKEKKATSPSKGKKEKKATSPSKGKKAKGSKVDGREALSGLVIELAHQRDRDVSTKKNLARLVKEILEDLGLSRSRGQALVKKLDALDDSGQLESLVNRHLDRYFADDFTEY
jgi:hypothetical protein